MRITRFINELCLLKDRASCSKNEKKASKHIFELFGLLGISAVVDEFKSQKSHTGELVLILLIFIAAIYASFTSPWTGVVIHTAGLILFLGYFTNQFKPFAPLFRHSISTNVIGRIRNESAPIKVVISAHHDTARSGLLWHPKMVSGFRISFLSGVALLVLAEVILISRISMQNSLVLDSVLILIGVYICIQIIVLIYSRFYGIPVQGANDNASGVAVMLDLAARLKDNNFKDIEFWFVSTGSEESGAVGMRSFLTHYQEDLGKNRTFFIVLDNVGSGTLHYHTAEGMLNLYPFSKKLINAASETASRPQFKDVTAAKYRLAYTDAIIPASKGYHAILLLATDGDGNIPNWHWETDTVEHIDFELVQKTSDFVLDMISRLHQTESANRELQEQIQDMIAG
ncbi:MAG: M28 family peptidase [candidate division KSB1 bacterium]|jgi:hypothetical protein|nr:M28 family peptidase [candidate division KSB1 bacterium]